MGILDLLRPQRLVIREIDPETIELNSGDFFLVLSPPEREITFTAAQVAAHPQGWAGLLAANRILPRYCPGALDMRGVDQETGKPHIIEIGKPFRYLDHKNRAAWGWRFYDKRSGRAEFVDDFGPDLDAALRAANTYIKEN